jgi:hypothetical protein
MTQRTVIEMMLERYGSQVSANNRLMHAIIRPMQYKNGASLNLPTEYYDNLHYLYTGPAEQKLRIGDEVVIGERSYVVKRSDTTEIGGEEVYVWAVLKVLAPDADREVYLEADGKRAAVADSYTAQTVQQSRAIAAWGEQEPVGTAAGAIDYELTLKNVCPEGGVDLYALDDFRLVAVRPGAQVVYSGCRWKNITAAGGAGNWTCREMKLTAAKREEQKEAETDG